MGQGEHRGTPEGFSFVLEGVDNLTFVRVLAALTRDPAFGKPLQLQVQEPRDVQPGRVTIAFWPGGRTRAVAAMQRFKTVLLDHGVQIDSVRLPGEAS